MSPESSPQGEVSRRHVLAGTAAALLWGPGVSRASAETSAPTIHWLVLRLLDGTSLTPLELNTMPVMLVFWETWCPYCKRHNVHIERLYQATRGMPIRVLGATTETNADKLTSYLRTNQLHFPVAHIERRFRDQFSQRRIIPLTCLVAANGRLLQAIPGEMGYADLYSLAGQVLQDISPKISDTTRMAS